MGERAASRVTNIAAPLRRRDRRGESASTTAQPCTLEARIDASASASARILRALHDGCGTFVLSAVDGQVSARIQLTITNTAAAETDYKLGSARVTVDWSRSTVANGARRVTLSRTELRLLSALLGGEGRAMTRASLISQVWPQGALSDTDRENALAVYICSLRKRLRSIGAGDALQTVRGVGYRAVL
jgi:OmpR family two-component system response regulator YxdJ